MAKIKTKYHLRSDGRLEATKMINGKLQHFYGRSDDEIDEKIAKAEAQVDAPLLMPQLVDEWWEKKEKELSPNTVSGFNTAKNRIRQYFEDNPAKDVTPISIIQFLQEFQAKGYSQKVISNTKSILKQILDVALIKGEITSNPCISLPIVKGKPKESRQAASDADMRILEEHKCDNLMMRMLYLMAYTGLRRGEAVALQEKHIDRKSRTIRVEQSCAWNNSEPILKEPKTESGKRIISISKNALEIIPKYKDKNTFIFFPDGLPRRKRLEKGLSDVKTQYGLQCTPHQLRHKYASLLHSAGVDVKDAQYLLGHSTIAMTQDIYTHLEETHKKKVARQIDSYVDKQLRQLSSSKSAK